MTDFRRTETERDPVANRTLSEAIVDRLRDSIVFGELRPGERLWQDRLADRFGVSRIPVREALRQLSAEGLVVLNSHRSATVAKLSPAEVEEMFAIAGNLEVLASTRGALRITDQEIAELDAIVDRMDELVDQRREWELLNYRFHLMIMRASGWPRLLRMVEEMRRNLSRYVSYELHGETVADWNRQHRAILEACRSRNPEAVRGLLEEHWRYTANLILASMQAAAAAD